jgi:hypothetical protein
MEMKKIPLSGDEEGEKCIKNSMFFKDFPQQLIVCIINGLK